ncbi:MAG: hypothetical protein EOP48_13270 [Sphingobacteriales bacterium]|nr:MAG: hypothetical protein EOP48_13270 [Sphingobacteriales bacterium]
MKIIVSHPTGNANVRAVAREFANAGMLMEFVTSIATFPGSLLEKLSHLKPFSELQRRSFDPLLSSSTKMFPTKEVGRLLAKKAGLIGLTAHEKGIFSTDAVYRDMDYQVMKRLRSGRLKGLDDV